MDEAEMMMTEEIAKRRRKLDDGDLERSIVVPVNQAIPVRHKVLTDEQVRRLLREHPPITVIGCGCRYRMGRCDAPIDVCIGLGMSEEDLTAEEFYREISIDEAVEILDRTAEAGLVHLTLWERGHTPFAICSCCPCCCHELQALLQYEYHDHVLKSDFIVEHDSDACIDCGTCIERCHFGALSEREDGVQLESGKCFGCGGCVMTCPSEALTLVERH
jgi:Pyruvate/2-oxoacid:ferredoxin oxidoreductase delta subunit